MLKFCVNCGTQLQEDAQFCTSCNTPVTAAVERPPALPPAPTFSTFPPLPAQSSHSFVWAAAIQVYWLLHGMWAMTAGGVFLGIGLGMMGATGMRGLATAGAESERILITLFTAFVAGAVDACVSVVLVYGLLTAKYWAPRIFMVWLPVKIVLWILTFALSLTPMQIAPEMPSASQPMSVTMIEVLSAIFQIGALVAGFVLVRRGRNEAA